MSKRSPSPLQKKIIELLTGVEKKTRTEVAALCGSTASYVSWVRHIFILGKEDKVRMHPERKKETPNVEYTEIVCIGPLGDPHTFMSTDPKMNRLCAKCKKHVTRSNGYNDSSKTRMNRNGN